MQKSLSETLNKAYALAVGILREPADAYDVIQDAASIALSHDKAPVQGSPEFLPWFCRVVRNKSIDKLRDNNRRNSRHVNNEEDVPHFTEEIAAESAHANFDPEHKLLASEAQKQLHTALDSLRSEHKEIVLLKDYHGFSYEQISQILGIAKGSVMSRLHRARLALQTQLAKQCD